MTIACFKKTAVARVLGLLLFVNATAVFAAEPAAVAAKTHELSRLSQLILRLRQGLTQDRSQQITLHHALQHTEKNLDQVSTHLAQLNKHLSAQTKTLTLLQKNRTQYEQSLTEQQTALAHHLRTLYGLGHHDALDVLMAQHDPALLNRSLTYFTYIHRARLALIENLQASIDHLQQHEQQSRSQAQLLKTQREKQERERHELMADHEQHEQLLGQITQKIQTNNQKLAQLLANKAALENVLKQLQTTETTHFPSNKIAFNKLQGKLPWPTAGHIVEHFGAQMDQSELKYSGVVISAPLGQAIHAIYPGRVVF